MLIICSEDPYSTDASELLEELSETLKSLTGDSGRTSFDMNDVRGDTAKFLVARDQHGRAVGCGAFRPMEQDIAEVKRMFARHTGLGTGTAILAALENEAIKMGYTMFRLETRVVNEPAVNFYKRHGYYRIPNFGKYVGKVEAACFEKVLAKL